MPRLPSQEPKKKKTGGHKGMRTQRDGSFVSFLNNKISCLKTFVSGGRNSVVKKSPAFGILNREYQMGGFLMATRDLALEKKWRDHIEECR